MTDPKPQQAKHTSGPWEAKVGQDATVWCPDGRHFVIGDAIYHTDNIANAVLIAAAPELYDELFRALAVIRNPQAFETEQVAADIERVLGKAGLR